jgi:hypothetical protein
MDVGTDGEARAVPDERQTAPFIEAMLAPELTRTENMAATYGSSGSALVDFFFSVLPDTAPQDVQKMLRRVRGRLHKWLSSSTTLPTHQPACSYTQHWVAPAAFPRPSGRHHRSDVSVVAQCWRWLRDPQLLLTRYSWSLNHGSHLTTA